MKINAVKNNVVNTYKNSTSKVDAKVSISKKDTIELSSAGKTLSAFALDSKCVNSKEKIDAIRSEVMQGTYKMDSTLTAKKIIEVMKGRDI
ncbi:flagellar biosynthesis anti-sigma factor FlgM [Clostridium sp. CS001]|uniref:flagellar biosynthesis anti-sigma factor FlgM n=1 Tax=Clostridium sp. CS001 TaxID=2880648 RepID=UPI001CF534A2|nr:flagellar biosynthesis anti-sigma factor FlgM [Clostridium sp. CS001]MCB2288836.1 flagellar biosynthesis anti-sigma factor FlgM [Clostridium sp. CS001]